ncbi:MAG: hypothetical protein ACTSYB_15280 [Candidatus Helarchaeota archaeon]
MVINIGTFLGIYYGVAKLFKEKEVSTSLKLIGYYFLLALTVYHLIGFLVIGVLISLHEYYIAIWFYDISKMLLLVWIAALCVQGIQRLQKEQGQEIRTLIKVFSSLFGSYALTTVTYLIVSSMLVNLVIR